MSENIVKGANYVYTKEYILITFGDQKWEKILSKLSPASLAVWDKKLILIDTFPFEPYKELINVMAEVCGDNSTETLGKVYEYTAHKSLNSVYKMFISLTEPAFIIKRYPFMWNRFFNAGTIKITKAGKGSAEIEFVLPEVFADWIEPACYGFSKAAVEIAGGSRFNQKLTSNTRQDSGDHKYVFNLSWTEE